MSKDKPMVGARVSPSIKEELTTKATIQGISVASLIAQILEEYCTSEGNTSSDSLNQNLIKEHLELKKNYDLVVDEVEALEKDWEELLDEVKELRQEKKDLVLKGQNIQLSQSETIKSIPNDLELSNKDRFERQINYFVKNYPNYTKSQLIELAVACTYQNDQNFFIVYKMGHFLNKYPNYTKLKKAE